MKPAVILVVVLAIGLVGLLLAGWLEESTSDDADTALDATGEHTPASVRKDPDVSAETSGRESEPVTTDGETGPLVPRVLPPGAALEDVRDALAANDTASVRTAYERITRMALKSASFGAALKRMADLEGDAAVAMIVRRAAVTPWAELTDAQRQELLDSVR